MILEPGRTVDRYVVEAVIGQGGMAMVYRVRHVTLGSHHALKVLSLSSAGLTERLLQEGRVQASLRHPNVVAVTDVLDVDGSPGLVMEYVSGPSLEQWLQTTAPHVDLSVRLFRDIVAGVGAAHAQGLVHRDLKPANVLLAPHSGAYTPKVTDFGLVKALFGSDAGMKATRSGVAMGTPQYMAPEQIRDAGGVDRRADVFSLGCMLYELTCGRPPFDGPDILSIFNRVASGDFAPPDSLVPDLPRGVQLAIRGSIVVDPGRRIADCEELLRVLGGGELRVAATTMVPDSVAMHDGVVASAETWIGPGMELTEDRLAGPIPPTAMTVEVAPVETPSVASSSALSMGSMEPDTSSLGSLEPAEAPAKPRRKRGRWLLAGAGLMVVGAAAAVVLLTIAGAAAAWGGKAWQEQQVRDALRKHTRGEAVPGAVSLGLEGIVIRDVEVLASDGTVCANIARVRMIGNPVGLALGLDRVREVHVEGVTIDLHENDGSWALPDATLAALTGSTSGRTTAPVDLIVGSVRVKARSADGTLHASWDGASVMQAQRTPAGWTSESLRIGGVAVSSVQPVLEVREIFAEHDTARITGLDLWLRTGADGYLDLPPIIADGVPTYLGGRAAGGSWMDDALALAPADLSTMSVESGTVHLVDTANARQAVEWTLVLDQGRLHQDGEDWRVTGLGDAHGGRVTYDGGIDDDGMFSGRLHVHGAPLERLQPYVADALSDHQVQLTGGELDVQLDFGEHQQSLGWMAEVTMGSPQMALLPGKKGTRSSRRLLAPRERVAVDAEGVGSLHDMSYRPVQDLLEAVTEALLEPAGQWRFVRTKLEEPVAAQFIDDAFEAPTAAAASTSESLSDAASAPVEEAPAPVTTSRQTLRQRAQEEFNARWKKRREQMETAGRKVEAEVSKPRGGNR